MTRSLHYIAFFLGLAAIGWVGAGYLGSNPLALAMTVLIGAFYLMGGFELRRFDEATSGLNRAVIDLRQAPENLGAWIGRLHPSLQNAVRLRVEGERVGLPGPAMTPYLAGLLVLLGMLGTFLGMVVTLNGTGMALDSATDLQAVRASLSAPVRGLGLAFGTSVAGVAASAMLGLVSALCRRDRLQAAQSLDARIATVLRVFSTAHQRDESFKLLQLQADAVPRLLGRMQDMMSAMERQGEALHDRLVAGQDRFHSQAEAVYGGLAASVDKSLKTSLSEGARVAGATIQPVVEATMAGIAREAASLHEGMSRTVERQLDGMSSRIETTTAGMADLWKAALAGHERTSEAMGTDLRGTLAGFAETFEQRSASLLDAVSTRLEASVTNVSDTWRDALAEHERVSRELSAGTADALASAAATFDGHSASLVHSVGRAHADLQAELVSRDEHRLVAWADAMSTMATSLQTAWQLAGERTAAQQQDICRTLAQTANEMSAQAGAHARDTIAEIAQLAQAASEAPRAAAEVISELRQKLVDGMERDNAMLDERSRILQTLASLLDAVNHASTEQRAAIDSLVSTSADLLDRVGTRFSNQVEAEAGKMAEVAAQITGSAVEVASLGDAFGAAVQLFSQSNDKLGAQLQRIEGALAKSLARSDEQLAYYVAQAREVIDLSIMSQKQIVEDLQQLAARREPAASEA